MRQEEKFQKASWILAKQPWSFFIFIFFFYPLFSRRCVPVTERLDPRFAHTTPAPPSVH
ncbi:hypothetical protein BDW62DRAFT_161617 [Aspergillus aurantiobrunneus]